MSYLFLLSRLGTIRIHTKMATTPKLKNTNYMTRRRDSCLVVYSSKSYSQLNSFVCDCDLSILILMFSKRFVSSGQWHSWSRHRTQYQEGSVIYTLIEYAMSNATCFFVPGPCWHSRWTRRKSTYWERAGEIAYLYWFFLLFVLDVIAKISLPQHNTLITRLD